MTAKEAAPKRREKVEGQYYHDGKPFSERQNKLSSVAYWKSQGLARVTKDNPDGRLGAEEFEALLVDLGAKDPRAKNFKVTLPNGHVISFRAGVTEYRPARAKKATPKKKGAAKKAPAKKAAPKRAPAKKAAPARKVAAKKAPAVTKPKPLGKRAAAAAAKQAAAKRTEERAAVRAWEDGGKVGRRPATPFSDELAAKSGPSKTQQRIAAESAQTPVRPTNRDRRVRAKTFRGPVPKPSQARKSA